MARDGQGRPLAVRPTPDLRGDNPELPALPDSSRVPRPGGVGRPRKRPDHLIAAEACSHPSTRRLLPRRGIPHTIPGRDGQRARRAHRPGRTPPFDRDRYRRRTVVERRVNRLKQWRGLANRFERRAVNYRALVVIAALMIWLGQ